MTGIQFRGLVYYRKVNCMRIRREDYLEGHGDLVDSLIAAKIHLKTSIIPTIKPLTKFS